MTDKAKALHMIWKQTHPDYRGYDNDGDKSIMLNAGEGGGIAKLSKLTDVQIAVRIPSYKP